MLFGKVTSYQEIFWKPAEPAFIEGGNEEEWTHTNKVYYFPERWLHHG